MHDENITTYCEAWNRLLDNGQPVENCFIGGYDDLYPNDEMGGEA